MFKTETECTPKRVSWWRLVFCALRKRCRFNPSSQVVSSFGLSRPYRRDIADQPMIKALNKYCMVYAVNILIHSHPSLHVSLQTKCRYHYYLIKFSRECYTIWRFGPLRMLYCFSASLRELSAVLVFMWKQLQLFASLACSVCARKVNPFHSTQVIYGNRFEFITQLRRN